MLVKILGLNRENGNMECINSYNIVENPDFSKTLKERADIHTAKLRWRAGMRELMGNQWKKISRKLNVNNPTSDVIALQDIKKLRIKYGS